MTRTLELAALRTALLIVLGAVVGLDQTSKIHAEKALIEATNSTTADGHIYQWHNVFMLGVKDPDPGEPPYFMSLRLHYSRNYGLAFRLLGDWDEKIRTPLIYSIYALGLALLIGAMLMTPPHLRATQLGLTFVISGAIGNLLDRIRLGYVVDFVDIEWQLFSWMQDFAIFNLADVAINVGVLVIVIEVLIHGRRPAHGA